MPLNETSLQQHTPNAAPKSGFHVKRLLVRLQLSGRLDELLEMLCTEPQVDTVEEAEAALRALQERTDTIGTTRARALLTSLSHHVRLCTRTPRAQRTKWSRACV